MNYKKELKALSTFYLVDIHLNYNLHAIGLN